jgi:hypothetical protein
MCFTTQARVVFETNDIACRVNASFALCPAISFPISGGIRDLGWIKVDCGTFIKIKHTRGIHDGAVEAAT